MASDRSYKAWPAANRPRAFDLVRRQLRCSPAHEGRQICSAAAIIIDNDLPRPSCARLPDGMFHLCRPGTNGYSFTVRSSLDLTSWTVLCTNAVTDGAVHYVDPDAANFNTRFYRVVAEPAYPPGE